MEYDGDEPVCPLDANREPWHARWEKEKSRMMKTFENHVLTTIEEYNNGRGEFLFARPDSGTYSMRVIFRPHTIIVYGDIRPCVILRQHGIDLPWLRGSVNDPCYLMEKDISYGYPDKDHEDAWYLVAGLQAFVDAWGKAYKEEEQERDV